MVLHPSVKNNFGDTNPPLADCSCILSIAILIFERIVTPKNARMNILLIEDDKMLLRMLTKNLEDHGHRVFGAGDGREAVDLALENEVDAIVCDLMMPVISGVTFLHSREKFMPPDIPVIVISGLEEGENVLKSLDVKYQIGRAHV